MKKVKCTRCGKELKGTPTYLELSITDGHYHGILPKGHESQGGFPFGEACSISECIDTAKYIGGLPGGIYHKYLKKDLAESK